MNAQLKRCPACNQVAEISAYSCTRCGHVFRTPTADLARTQMIPPGKAQPVAIAGKPFQRQWLLLIPFGLCALFCAGPLLLGSLTPKTRAQAHYKEETPEQKAAVQSAANKLVRGQSISSVESILGIEGEYLTPGNDPSGSNRMVVTYTYEVTPGDYLMVVYYQSSMTVCTTFPPGPNTAL